MAPMLGMGKCDLKSMSWALVVAQMTAAAASGHPRWIVAAADVASSYRRPRCVMEPLPQLMVLLHHVARDRVPSMALQPAAAVVPRQMLVA